MRDRDGGYPGTRLGHKAHHEQRIVGNTRQETTLWATQPVGIPRPATGITAGDLVCDSCGEAVEVRVASVAITRRWRRWWLALTVVVLLALTVVTVVGIQIIWTDLTSRTGELGPQIFLLIMATSFLVTGTVVLFRRWRREDGVRGPGDDWRTLVYRGRSANMHNLLPPT